SLGFSSGAHGPRPSAMCAVCLRRNNHSFIDCPAERIWDNSHPVVSKRVNKQLLPLCVDWQRGRTCPTRAHDKCHLRSGCLSASHGAQSCPRTQ
ncbi:hypothetical protein CY34DRAFT_65847, partial [Suillus luteus UH-Slu-Lm8-n1]